MYVYIYLYIHACVYMYIHTHTYIFFLSLTHYVSSGNCEVNPVRSLIKIILNLYFTEFTYPNYLLDFSHPTEIPRQTI